MVEGMSQGPQTQRLRPFKPVRFGRYTLLMPMSTGGMGEIFLARLEGAHGFDKLCVIKRVLARLAEDPDFVERFVNEARVLGQLSHGNIAQVLDMGVHQGAPYLALELVDGKDLRRVLSRARERQEPLPLPFVLYTMSRVLDALAYAHRKRGEDDRDLNLVHRDVSPQNLLVSYEGEVKIIDFGLAKSTLSSAKTSPGIIMGKFRYMSPEQARHQRVDRRSDLYAAGLCLYELISGQSPFEAAPQGDLLTLVGNPSIRPLVEITPSCPPALSDVVMKALAVDPTQRFQSAEELRARLTALLVELDASAGPEMAARLMHEIFAVEYHAERKMLSSLRGHARSADADDEPTSIAPADAGTHPTTKALQLIVEEAGEPPRAQPPRRPPPRRALEPEAQATLQAIPALEVPPSPPTPPRATPKCDAADEAETPVPMGPPEEALPSPEPLPLPLPSPSGSRATRPRASAEPRRGRLVSRPSSPRVDRKKATKSQERPALKQGHPRPSATAKSGRGVLVWLLLPLLAVLAVAGYIAWDLYADPLKTQQVTALPSQPRGQDPKKAVKKPLAGKPLASPREEAIQLPEPDFDQPISKSNPPSPPPSMKPSGQPY